MCSNGMFGMRTPNERAKRPTEWTHDDAATVPSIELKFHHSISWDCLRDAWQGLLEYGQWAALEAYMNAVGVPGASAARGRLHRGEPLDQVTLAHVFDKISWPGWNIVQGPGERLDEGGKEVDLFLWGMSDAHKERMTTLNLLWIEMSLLLGRLNRPAMRVRREASNPDKPGAVPVTVMAMQNNNAVNDAASRLERAFHKMAKFREESYVPYIHSMWTTVIGGRVNPLAVAQWLQVPQFQKALGHTDGTGNMPPNMRCTRCRGIYARPRVPPGTMVACPSCTKQTYVDFKNAA